MSDIDHAPSAHREVSWATLGGRVRAWRVVHASWSVVQLWCLGDMWVSVLRRRRTADNRTAVCPIVTRHR